MSPVGALGAVSAVTSRNIGAEFMCYRAVKAPRSHEALRRRFAPDGRAPPRVLRGKEGHYTTRRMRRRLSWTSSQAGSRRAGSMPARAPKGPIFEGVTRSSAHSQLQRGDSGLVYYPNIRR